MVITESLPLSNDVQLPYINDQERLQTIDPPQSFHATLFSTVLLTTMQCKASVAHAVLFPYGKWLNRRAV